MTASGIRSGVHIVDTCPFWDRCRTNGCTMSTSFVNGIRDGPDYITTLGGALHDAHSGYAETA